MTVDDTDETTAPAVTLHRTYAADAATVWRAWTDPSILGRWYGCQPDQLWRIHEWHPRVGGALHVSMDVGAPDTPGPPRGDDGRYHVRGEFLVVDEPHRLEYSFGDGQRIEVMLDAADGSASTEVTVRHHGFPPDGPPPTEMAAILDAGWTASLHQLAGALSS
ncbi:MAG: SRPBCC domain-containing protein [Actinomycetota bacterium]